MNTTRKALLAATLAVAALAGVWLFRPQELLPAALDRLARMGPGGWLLFVGLYAAATVFLIPGSILTLGAGAVFGVARGVVLASVSSTAGALAAFLVGRYLARDWVAAKIQGQPRLRAVDDAVAREGWRIVGLTRLTPLLPFCLLNYAFGVSRVSLRDYLLASWIEMLPGTLLYVYLGSVAGDLARTGKSGPSRTPAQWAMTAIGLAATAGVTILLSRIAKRALAAKA